MKDSHTGFGVMPWARGNVYGFMPDQWKRSSVISGVSRSLKRGDIQKSVGKKGEILLELTLSGKNEYKKRFPLMIKGRKWDGYFMVVIFDIPEEHRVVRAKLRRKLKELGFGMLQRSVWISPHHIEIEMNRFLKYSGLRDKVFVLRAKKLHIEDLNALANRVWRISKINKQYQKIVKLIKDLQQKGDFTDKLRGDVISKYLEVLIIDPMLPVEFLPANWARSRLLGLLK